MVDKQLSRLAWLVTAAGLALLAGAVLLILLLSTVPARPGDSIWYNDLLVTASLAVAIVVGGFVAARLPVSYTHLRHSSLVIRHST